MILALFLVILVLVVVLPLAGWALWLVVSTAISGLVIGALGRLVVPGRQPIGVVATILCGLGGAIVGGLIGRAIGTGHIANILLEIGVAAAAVAVVSGTHRGRLTAGRRSGALPRGW